MTRHLLAHMIEYRRQGERTTENKFAIRSQRREEWWREGHTRFGPS